MKKKLEKIQPLIDKLLAQQNRVILAIDGNCTAGKTTLAGILADIYRCDVIHMDDFFLRPEQRTPERYAQTGGNIDYERFQEEVLLPLKSGESFSYRPFDCKSFTLKNPVTLHPGKLTIIEGTYSHHPYFGDPYDLKVFMSVSEEVQHQRILERPIFLHQRFFQQWIPMEQSYFDGFHIPQNANIQL